jgi:hypothetical protein
MKAFISGQFLPPRLENTNLSGSNKTSPTRVCLATTIVAIAFLATTLANASHAARLSEAAVQGVDQEDLLWWLPPDTESVVAARGPFPLRVPSDNEDENWGKRKASQTDIFVQFEQQPLELLYSGSLPLATLLRGSIVTFAMQGSRHFRQPLPGFEVMDFEGCSIVAFDNRFSERGEDFMQTLAKAATAMMKVVETRVLVFHGKSGSAEWDFFLALPRPNVLLAANNLPYLQEVLERMAQRKSPRALPDQLPEWSFLDRGVRFWGLRHYDRTQAKQDPTSPFGDDRTFGPGDQKAIGILFALNPNKQKEAAMTYLSGDEAMVRTAMCAGTSSEKAEITSVCGHESITRDGAKTYVDEKPQEGVEYKVEFRSPAPGVLQHIYTLERTGTLSYFMLNMEVALGRGMWF